MKKTFKSIFESDILPGLKAAHSKDGKVNADSLNAAIKSGYTILDDATNAPVDYVVEVQPTNDNIGELVSNAITKALTPVVKSLNDLPRIQGGTHHNDDDGKWGFKSPAEYFTAITNAGNKQRPVIDDRLQKGASAKDFATIKASPTTYSAESSGTDGGFTVPPDFRLMVIGDQYENENLLGMCDTLITGSNNVTIPTDETTPWQTTGGVQAYWAAEAATYTQSKVQLRQVTQILEKLTALVPVTDELLQDSFMIAQYVPKKASQKIDWKIGEAIFRGTGAGMPQGFLNATTPTGPTITVSAESGQSAATIVYNNVTKMRSRVMPSSIASGKLRWFMQPDCFPQIQALTLGNYPIYTPPTYGAADAPFGTLQGIPIVLTQHCNTLGTLGDIILADLSQYLAVTKGNSITAQTSIHLWFDQDLIAYKFTFRMAGQPWRSTPVPSQYGSNTLSYFVDLATRS